MELRLSPEHEVKLADMATRTGRSPMELLSEAVSSYLAEKQKYLDFIQAGIDQAEQGQFVEDADVLAWLEQRESLEYERRGATHDQQR